MAAAATREAVITMNGAREIDRAGFLRLVGLGMAAVGAGAALPVREATAGAPRALAVYSGNFSPAIELAELNLADGELTGTGSVPGVDSPAFLIGNADGTRVYAVNDIDEGRVTALSVGPDGGLTVLGSQPAHAVMPTHLAIFPGGQHLIVANYGSGSTAVFPILPDGALGPQTDLVQYEGSGPVPGRQEGPHAHMVAIAPDGRHVLVPDLGTDTIHVHGLNTGTGKLETLGEARLAPGAGPRHLVFHPRAPFLYVANELDSTVTVCAHDGAQVTPGQVISTVPPGAPDNFPAEILISADGRFVYVSNRGHDSIARFAVEAAGERLRLVDTVPCGGRWPRHIAITPDGRWMHASNQYSNTITAFQVDPDSGALSPVGEPFPTPSPVCLLHGGTR
ncbi:lactonase family protein [Saccharopolyspora indica]|uniref:lactonase family protein n=1 Tax=Saccharopolyspora indica TaxID=1229659 RepID=UPI0022EB3C0D|nr:lactonase family protein [Saccharopolyspora indica]MDA3642692.1 lactonase family protein [Saccharopolyspora indica]